MDLECAKVKSVKFGVLSPDEIRAMSVCEIEHEEAFEAGNKIREGGLLDLRLGPLDKKSYCQTCDSNMDDCVGHFGHLEFDKPIYHVGMIKHMADILRCVCFHCSRLLINKRSEEYRDIRKQKNPVRRMKMLLAECKNQAECNFYNKKGENEGCEGEQPIITVVDNVRIEVRFSKVFPEYSDKEVFWLNGELAVRVLKRIEREDYHALSCSEDGVQPHWLAIEVLPVPPTVIRPSNLSNAAARGEDDLTHKLSDVVRMRNNTRSKQKAKGSDGDVAKYHQMVQIYGAGYFDNNAVGHQQIMQRMGRPQKGLRQRLKGKEGRIRGSLMGKRVDFTARTVITPDPCIKTFEVGIPEKIAKNVTRPEIVNRFNIDDLRKRIQNGVDHLHGAMYIEYQGKNARKLDLRKYPDIEKRKKIELVEGCIVHRYLKDGDPVIMNRQPSLHRYSTQGHKAKIMKFQTARLPLPTTKPYNADFDGDEMNIHIPQDAKTAAEVELLMGVPQNFCTPQSNKPVMGIVQDSLSACYVLSLRDTFLERHQVMQIVGFLESWDGVMPKPAIFKPKQLWTGKQILSLVMGKLNIERFSKFRPDSEDKTPHIERLPREEVEKLLKEKFEFTLDEKEQPLWTDTHLRNKLKSLERERYWMTPSDTRVYIKDGEVLSGIFCNKTLGTAPGSLIQVFANDSGPDGVIRFVDDIQEIGRMFMFMFALSIGPGDMALEKDNQEVREKLLNAAKNEMENIRKEASITEKECEIRFNKVLNDVRRKVSEDTLTKMSLRNCFAIPVRSGAKGEPSNPAQVVRTIGQNNVEGKRIPLSFEGRCLPHFTRGDYSPEARGYVNSNFMEGVNPSEYWFQSSAAREGIIDGAIKTSEIGYGQRRLVKAMEDVKIVYDGTTRNALGDVIQFANGEDGYDPTFMEWQFTRSINMNKDKFKKWYKWSDDVLESDELLKREWCRLLKDSKSEFNPNKPLPVNIARLLDNIPKELNDNKLLEPRTIVEEVFKLQQELWKSLPEGAETWEAPFAVMLRCYLSSKRMITKYKINRKKMDWIKKQIIRYFNKSIIAPGECVGAIAGQSLGEPATQVRSIFLNHTNLFLDDVEE
jgi:DNA-directed RNA polymerase II subunit RPB1